MPVIRILSGELIRETLSMPKAIALMRDAFAALSAGEVTVPVRSSIEIPEHEARALFMPAYAPGSARLGLKVVTMNPGNAGRGLPFIHALVLVSDAATGEPLALMDGECITAIRTGAGAGLATDLLARRDARVAAIFGAGVQARTQLEAVCAVRHLEKAFVFGRDPDNAEVFAREMRRTVGVDVEVASRPELLSSADIVCTATTSLTPVFRAEHLKAGCHINGVGSYRPDMTEIPHAAVCGAKVVVDQRAACLKEAGDILTPLAKGLITESHIHAELGEVASGNRAGRESDSEITFFKSVGNAVQDLAVATYLAARAKEDNLGARVAL